MDSDNFVVEVLMTANHWPWGEQIGQREFKVEGPFETIAELEIGMSMDRLYAELMRVVFESLTDEKTEEE